MHDLLQFWNVVESIATFTVISVFEALGLLVGGESSRVDAIISIEVVILSRLEAHHTKLYESLCRTSAADPSSRLAQELPVTANIKKAM
jgi:hypothetical protein